MHKVVLICDHCESQVTSLYKRDGKEYCGLCYDLLPLCDDYVPPDAGRKPNSKSGE